MSLAAITFHVQDLEGQPIAGCLLNALSPNGAWQGLTDGAGSFTANLAPGHYDITFTAAGFAPRVLPADLADPGLITVGLERASSAIHIDGIDFLHPEGSRLVYCGTDQFCAYRQYLDQGLPGIAPLIMESIALGFTLWRVFFQGSLAQNGILDLRPSETGYYDRVRPFVDDLNEHGITLLATIFVDNQDIHAGLDHWSRMAGLLRGSNTLLSGGNEAPKNGFDPSTLTDPGMVWSRGSNLGDAPPPSPYASFAEFHPRRDLPKTLDDAVASATFLYGQGLHAPLVIDEPLGFADTDQPGKRSNDPRVAWELARIYATMCAGACFHNDDGMRGQLISPTVKACAQQWVRGMML